MKKKFRATTTERRSDGKTDSSGENVRSNSCANVRSDSSTSATERDSGASKRSDDGVIVTERRRQQRMRVEKSEFGVKRGMVMKWEIWGKW